MGDIHLPFFCMCTVGADDSVRPIMKMPKIKNTIIGEIVNNYWCEIQNLYNGIKIHDYIIMPDHIHGIIEIQGGQGRPPLQKIIQGFKSVTTRKCFLFGYKQIWQRNYYEHIIRNEKELYQIIEYIEYNPLNWENDEYNI